MLYITINAPASIRGAALARSNNRFQSVTLCNARGQKIDLPGSISAADGSLAIDRSKLGRGVYYYTKKMAAGVTVGRTVNVR